MWKRLPLLKYFSGFKAQKWGTISHLLLFRHGNCEEKQCYAGQFPFIDKFKLIKSAFAWGLQTLWIKIIMDTENVCCPFYRLFTVLGCKTCDVTCVAWHWKTNDIGGATRLSVSIARRIGCWSMTVHLLESLPLVFASNWGRRLRSRTETSEASNGVNGSQSEQIINDFYLGR